MNEPLSATTVTALAGTTGFVAWWTNLDVSVVMGAFMGAVFFVISSVDLSRLVRAGYFSVSFFMGIVAAPIATEVMSGVLRTQARVPEALGALFVAAIAIKLLLFGTSPAGLRAMLSRVGDFIGQFGSGGKG